MTPLDAALIRWLPIVAAITAAVLIAIAIVSSDTVLRVMALSGTAVSVLAVVLIVRLPK